MKPSHNELENDFWLGVNYWPRRRGLAMWRDWYPEEIDAEFAEMESLGLNVARVFLVWDDFQPIKEFRAYQSKGEPVALSVAGDSSLSQDSHSGLVDPAMTQRLAELCRIAEKRHIRLIVAIFVGWMSGVCFEPRFLRGRNMFTDPTILRYEVSFCRYLAERFKDERAILAWDLGNEQNCFQPVPSVDAAWHWTYLMTSTLRMHDPNHPVMSGMHSLGTTRRASQDSAPWLIGDVAENCDCMCVHPYPDFVPGLVEPPLQPRSSLKASWQLRLYAGFSGKPTMAQEFGTLGDGCMSRKIGAAYTNRTLYSLLANGSVGAIWWCHSDFTVQDQLPYRTNLMEYSGLGLFDVNGKMKPTAQVFARFAEKLRALDLASLRKEPARAAIIHPWSGEHHPEVFNSFVLTRRAGIDADIVSPDDLLDNYSLLIVPAASGFESFTQPQWERIRAKVSEGATLYVSSAGGTLPGINDMAGVELQYREQVSGERRGIVLNSRPMLPEGAELLWRESSGMIARVNVTEGTVIAADADERPLLVERRWRKGLVILMTEPIERYLSTAYGASVDDESWRIYSYLKSAAELNAAVECDHPNIECGLLREGETEIAVLVNHSDHPVSAKLTAEDGILAFVDPDGNRIEVEEGAVQLELAANSGTILRSVRGSD